MNEIEPFAPPVAAGPVDSASSPMQAVSPIIPSPPAPPSHAPVPQAQANASSYSTITSSPGGYGQLVTDRREPNTAAVVVAWIATVLLLGYMLPWAIAATRGKSNQAAIGIVNLLLGWTVIGWIVALVMACQAHQLAGGGATTIVVSNLAPAHQVAMSAGRPAAGWFPAPDGNGRQYWDGVRWTEHRAP